MLKTVTPYDLILNLDTSLKKSMTLYLMKFIKR